MFGRNYNALQNTNPVFQHPQNNEIGVSTYSNQPTNFFNFQFQNQTINNNFPVQQPQFPMNYYQPPFQQPPNYNQNNATQESNDFSEKSIATEGGKVRHIYYILIEIKIKQVSKSVISYKFNKNFNFFIILSFLIQFFNFLRVSDQKEFLEKFKGTKFKKWTI